MVDLNTPFSSAVDQWLAVVGTLRDVVRQHVVAAQIREILEAQGRRRLRVLDVGCGQGTQALQLARAGHDVTGVDPSAQLLEHLQETLGREAKEVRDRLHLVQATGETLPDAVGGSFDLILCHGVLMYFADIGPILGAMTQVADHGATLSLVVRNGLAPAMRDGLRGNWALALEAFDRLDYTNNLGLTAHAHTPDQLDNTLTPLGWRRDQWRGVRVFTDHRDGQLPNADELADLLAAELEAGSRDPYRQVAALLHVTYIRDTGAESN